ncbi:MAG: hypothetical protein JJ992_12270 [Planctomycetes bacterium]|nr:hypothetical protein [Planctomycetota bacterium]
MRSLLTLTFAATLASLFVAAPCRAESTRTVRGLFGERTLGGPVAPRAPTRFDRGLMRGPSGDFLGLQRDQRFFTERPALRSSIPDTSQSLMPPPRPAPRQIAPYEPRIYTTPARPSVPPRLQPSRPPDTWLRTPVRRAR